MLFVLCTSLRRLGEPKTSCYAMLAQRFDLEDATNTTLRTCFGAPNWFKQHCTVIEAVESPAVVISTCFSSVHSPVRPQSTATSFLSSVHPFLTKCLQMNFHLVVMRQTSKLSNARMDNHITSQRSLQCKVT